MRPFYLLIWSLFFITSSCATYPVFHKTIKDTTLSDFTLKQNTRIKGHIRISGTLTVPKMVTLQIDPGTRVEFVYTDSDRDGTGDGAIVVEGTILAEGSRQEPILFYGSRTGPRSWSEIRLEHNLTSRFTHCEFKNAHWGLHIHFSAITISYCRFMDNYGGMRFRSGPVTIRQSLFKGNSIGIRYIAADPVIKNNSFENYTSAIFIREGSKRPQIRGNNFLDNISIAVKLGESQQNDIPAPENYWGSVKVSEIERVIYDKLDSGYLGRVLYDPVATKPYTQENTH